MKCGTVLISGGTRGIGLATASIMGKAGWSVSISGQNPDNLARAVATLQADGIKVHGMCFSVEDESSWDAAIAETEHLFGPVTSLVCNAGISLRRNGRKISFEDTDTEIWSRTFDVNVWGVLYGFKAATRSFLKHGTSGSMVAVSSLAGRLGIPISSSYYTAAKTAVIGLVRGAAADLGKHGIRVNAVTPGRIETEMTMEAGAEFNQSLFPEIALQRMGRPEEVGEVIEFLCSDRASYVTGASLDIAGGWHIS